MAQWCAWSTGFWGRNSSGKAWASTCGALPTEPRRISRICLHGRGSRLKREVQKMAGGVLWYNDAEFGIDDTVKPATEKRSPGGAKRN